MNGMILCFRLCGISFKIAKSQLIFLHLSKTKFYAESKQRGHSSNSSKKLYELPIRGKGLYNKLIILFCFNLESNQKYSSISNKNLTFYTFIIIPS